MPVNQTQASNYRVSGIQIWMQYDQNTFPESETEIFEIDYKGDTIKFYMSPNSDLKNRARIYARSLSNNQEFNGLSYYWNGIQVREPVVTAKEWGILGISFASSLVFDAYLGSINLNGPMVFNNISYYQENSLQQIKSTKTRPWLKVKTDGITNYDWLYWLNSFIWDGVLILGSYNLYNIDPRNIFQTYTGNNKTIIDDQLGLTVSADKLKIYQTVTWSSNVSTPA